MGGVHQSTARGRSPRWPTDCESLPQRGRTIEIDHLPVEALVEYAQVPIAFEAAEVLDVSATADGITLTPRRLEKPYRKDYDAIGDTPIQWAQRFDISKWALLVARVEGQVVGGAAVAHDDASVEMLEGRADLAVLWDIRVEPAFRGRGVGSALFTAAEAWAAARQCRELTVETQNTNAAACRFYARLGCALRVANRGVYSQLPDEVQLMWYKDLRTPRQ